MKQLPNSIGSLKNLQTLNISGNCLKELPLSMSGLVSLKTLDVRDNPKLKRIPKEIAQLRGLETLLLDEKHINYPDPEIVSKGTEAIMRFLCSGNKFSHNILLNNNDGCAKHYCDKCEYKSKHQKHFKTHNLN